jgi:hypothetical protein
VFFVEKRRKEKKIAEGEGRKFLASLNKFAYTRAESRRPTLCGKDCLWYSLCFTARYITEHTNCRLVSLTSFSVTAVKVVAPSPSQNFLPAEQERLIFREVL